MSIENDVRDILNAEFGLEAQTLDKNAPLFSSSLLDSLNSLKLLMALEAKFGLSISPLDVSIEDVDSIDSIAQTVQRLQG